MSQEAALRLYGIEHATTAVNNPQNNHLVERVNRTLTDVLALYANLLHTKWDDYFLPDAIFAFNTAKQFSLAYG